jgi:hypothetical protein
VLPLQVVNTFVLAEREDTGNHGNMMVRHPVAATKAIVIVLSFFKGKEGRSCREDMDMTISISEATGPDYVQPSILLSNSNVEVSDRKRARE